MAVRLELPEEAFRPVFERYYRPVYRFFEKRGFRDPDCHDLTQETFLGVYKGWTSFRGEASLSSWVFEIAANTYRKEVRRRSTSKRAGTAVPLDDVGRGLERFLSAEGSIEGRAEPAPLRFLLAGERVTMLERGIARLPRQMRRCVEFRIRQDLSYREIAVVTRLSVETVKVHLAQARKRLREDLHDDG